MADNVTIVSDATAGSPPRDTVIATDDIDGVQFQRVKLDLGADGESLPVSYFIRADPAMIDLLQFICELLQVNNEYLARIVGENLTLEDIEETN